MITILSKKLNERAEIEFEDDLKNKIKIVHMLKQSLCPIGLDEINGKQLLQSIRYGVMVHGITCVYLPKNFRFNVNLNDEVNASQTLIGYFS